MQRMVLTLVLRKIPPNSASVSKEMMFLMMEEMVCTEPLFGGGGSCSPGAAPGILGLLEIKNCPPERLQDLDLDR